MKTFNTVCTTALALLASCTDASPEINVEDADTPDFRDGSYHYVLGYDPATGEQIRGGSHQVVTFDDDGKTEAIDSRNRANRLHPDLTAFSDYSDYDSSLTSGKTDWDVFASTWWPMSKNGTAWRWQPGANQDYEDLDDVDTLSPMEKYDLMFNPGQRQVVSAVSNCAWDEYVDDRTGCQKTEQPQLTVAGPATKWELENQGNYQRVRPDSWWGHCNGWASYATSEPGGYPLRDVRVKLVNGSITECLEGDDSEGCIEWKMADIEGLFTELHYSDRATFTGRRCETAADEIDRDEYGRPRDVACRDLNPGSFHIAVTGMLARGARNLATGDDGFPAFVIDHTADYEVWNFPLNEFTASYEDVDAARANELIGANGSDYVFNDRAESFVVVDMRYSMISDGVPAAELLVRADQRDVDPHWVDLHYILEIDANDRIIGGEWIEDPVTSGGPNNQELHPDFAWMAIDAVGRGESADDTGGDNDNPHISLVNARALLRCANEPSSCEPAAAEDILLDRSATITSGEQHRYEVQVSEAGTYEVELTGTNDADLYVRVGEAPSRSSYDCRPFLDGSDERCQITTTGAATVHVMVAGYAATSSYRVTASEE